MMGIKPILPTNPSYRLPDYFADMSRCVLRREFVVIRPGLLKIDAEAVKARLESCLPPDDAACYDFGRQMGLLSLKPSSEVRVLGVMGLESKCKKAGRRIMPVMGGLLVMMAHFDDYRIKLLPEERAPNGDEYRLLTTLERVALLYFRLRPLVAPALLVRQLAALLLICGSRDDVLKYFHSPVVATILQCKYDDGKLDYEHPMVELFAEISRQPIWDAIISSKNRKRIFDTPSVRANDRDNRKAAFNKVKQAYPNGEVGDCLVLSDSLIAAFAGRPVGTGNGTRLKVAAYIFHHFPFWSMELRLPPGSRIERFDSWANYTPPLDDTDDDDGDDVGVPRKGAQRKQKRGRGRGGGESDDEESAEERLSDIDSEDEEDEGAVGSDDWNSDKSDGGVGRKAKKSRRREDDSSSDEEAALAKPTSSKTTAKPSAPGPSHSKSAHAGMTIGQSTSNSGKGHAKFVRELQTQAEIDQLKAGYTRYAATANNQKRITYFRCKRTGCKSVIRVDHPNSNGGNGPLALLYERGEHNHDDSSSDEEAAKPTSSKTTAKASAPGPPHSKSAHAGMTFRQLTNSGRGEPKFVRDLHSIVEIEQVKNPAEFCHQRTATDSRRHARYYRCRQAGCEFGMRIDHLTNPGPNEPMGRLYEWGGHNHDSSAAAEPAANAGQTRGAQFVRALQTQAEIDQLTAGYTRYATTSVNQKRIISFRCSRTGCKSVIRVDYPNSNGGNGPLALLYEKGEHNHDDLPQELLGTQRARKCRGRPPKCLSVERQPLIADGEGAPTTPRSQPSRTVNASSNAESGTRQTSISKFLQPNPKPQTDSGHTAVEVKEEAEGTAADSPTCSSLPGAEQHSGDENSIKEELVSIAPTVGSTVVFAEDAVKSEEGFMSEENDCDMT